MHQIFNLKWPLWGLERWFSGWEHTAFVENPCLTLSLHSSVSQPSVTIVPGDLTPSSGLPQVPAHTWLLREINVHLFKVYEGFIKLYAARNIKLILKIYNHLITITQVKKSYTAQPITQKPLCSGLIDLKSYLFTIVRINSCTLPIVTIIPYLKCSIEHISMSPIF